MSTKNQSKATLLAYKKQLLEEIQYSQKSIDDLRSKIENKRYDEEPDSSDSEDYFPNAIGKGPDIQKLKYQHSMLKICQNAAQELTGLTVLQSEVNVLVEVPKFEGERPVTEPGTWREVTAECRIDLVPFTITFLTHTGLNMFAPTSYRALKSSLVKTSHEVELNNSVLQAMRTPSDAVEVIRSYAAAYRSRRTTLAHLANKYATSLFMEPHPEGGFLLKCANLLEILWRLENKWSPLVPFHHRMKFDLEYMDESYVKIITQAHKELLDPSIQTDERTLLLAKIIATCLEARGPVDSESDLESVGVMSRKTENHKETDPKDKDNEIMAPPKKLPKKTKTIVSKDKNISKSNTVKRGMEDVNMEENAKKMKPSEVAAGNKNVKNKEKSGTNDKISNDNTENIVKDKDNLKKKTNEKTNDKKQISNVKANLKKSKQKDNDENVNNNVDRNNKKTDEEKTANKRKHDENNQTETKNVDSQKQIKNAKPKTIIENIEPGQKNIKSAKNTNKTEKSTKTNKRQITTNDIENERNKNIDDKHSDNNKNQAIENNDNDLLSKKKNSKTAITADKNVDNECNINDTPKTTDKNAKISMTNKDVRIENNKNDLTAKAIGKGAKNANMNEKNIDNHNKNDVPPKIVHKKAKLSTVNDKKNKNDMPAKKIDKKTKMAIANDKKFDVITKRVTDVQNKNNNKKDELNNAIDTNLVANNDVRPQKSKNIEKPLPSNSQTQHNSNEILKNKTTGNTDIKTVKKSIEKNIIKTVNTKESVASIKNKKINLNTIRTISKNIDKNQKVPKINTKTVRDTIHKSPLLKNPLKLQNSQKSSNTKTQNKGVKMFSGNTEKENDKNTKKIPQKKTSIIENNFKNNMLRISPRNHSSKFKTISTSKELVKRMMKNTNIPRLMKLPVPRTSK